MKPKLLPLTESPRYVSFLQQRDAGLEQLLAKYHHEISKIIATLRLRACETAAHMMMPSAHQLTLKRNRELFEQRLRPVFEMAVHRTTALLKSLRRTTYVISAVGGSEAIYRATGKRTKLKLAREHIDSHHDKEMPLGGSTQARVDLAYSRLLRDVVDAFQSSQVQDSTPTEAIERIGRMFPVEQKLKRPKRVMAKMREADKPKIDIRDPADEFDFFTQEEWDAAVADYLDEYVPNDRAPNSSVFVSAGEDTSEFTVYNWQVEKEMTDDFIDSVRNGEDEAAKQAGIEDFQWIAIVDSKTDQCCFTRDGLTVTEIEEKLDNGDLDAELCDATAAPAHPYCRCRMAPMVAELPDETPADLGGFDDWLDSMST